MTEVSVHPTPGFRDVLIEQIRIVTLHLRPEALLVAAVLAAGTLLIGAEIVGGGPGFDSSETFPTAIISFLFPFAVWRGVRRFGPDFLWTLPVDRRRLALARALAGWVWLMSAVAIFALWLLALALIARAPAAAILARIPYTATAAAYLFGSALVLGLRHPLRWLFGIIGLIVVTGGLRDMAKHTAEGQGQLVAGAAAFFSAVIERSLAWLALPDLSPRGITAFLWFGAGLAALWAALLRHRELRRH